jgi:hypothetical protein
MTVIIVRVGSAVIVIVTMVVRCTIIASINVGVVIVRDWMVTVWPDLFRVRNNQLQ